MERFDRTQVLFSKITSIKTVITN